MTTPDVPPEPPTARPPERRSSDVETFLAALDHPHVAEIFALREIILGADPAIAEGIRWNAPSFRTSEYFATFHLRARDGVRIILHFGAKRRARGDARAAISDPTSLLHWLAADRASVSFGDLREVEGRRSDFSGLIREWIARMPP